MIDSGTGEANLFGLAFVVLMGLFILVLPRRWAALPFLIGACYVTAVHLLKVGPFHFNVIRLLAVFGIARLVFRREWLRSGMIGMDWLMVVWGLWGLAASFFHNDPSATFVNRLGLVYNTLGIYFLVRIFCQSVDDVILLSRFAAILFVPVALEMINEKVTAFNLFSIFGGVAESPAVREGVIRAQGPFAHPILAGTMGAVSFPIMIGLWQKHKKTALIGAMACLAIVLTSGSSGPILSLAAGIGALFMWYFRQWMKFARWGGIVGYVGLDVMMKAPAYYLLGRIDLAGGSTGWHRAALIESAFQHIDEWWLTGTDYTRHWMPTGVSWSPDHSDITNHYLHLGVLGGLPLMLLFIGILLKGFSYVGGILKQEIPDNQFFVWTLGASLFAHAATCISVAYFDQSFLFLYLTLAGIGSSWSSVFKASTKEDGEAVL